MTLHEWDAYCLDNAVTTFARALEAEVSRTRSRFKNPRVAEAMANQVLARWLDQEDAAANFKDPGA